MLQRVHTALAALCLVALATAAVAGRGDAGTVRASPDAHAAVSFGRDVHGLEKSSRRNDGALVARDRVSGTGNVNADHVIIEGVLSPGHSPGCLDFGGNVTFSFSATLLIEIGGAIPCTGHDRVSVANTLTINSATLDVELINSFMPQFGERFDVLDWGSLTGTFGIIDTSAATLSYPLVWDTSELYLTGELIVDVQHFADGDLAPWNAPDGQINAADVLIAIQLALGTRTPGPLQYAHGDMNIDSVIDVVDLLLLGQVVQ